MHGKFRIPDPSFVPTSQMLGGSGLNDYFDSKDSVSSVSCVHDKELFSILNPLRVGISICVRSHIEHTASNMREWLFSKENARRKNYKKI